MSAGERKYFPAQNCFYSRVHKGIYIIYGPLAPQGYTLEHMHTRNYSGKCLGKERVKKKDSGIPA